MENNKSIIKEVKSGNKEEVETWFCDKDLSSVDSINQETYKGTYMENMQEIYIYIYMCGIYKEYRGPGGGVGACAL